MLAILLVVAVALLAGCGKSQNTEPDDTSGTMQAQSFAWSASSDCTTCHATETESAKDTTMLIAKHAGAGVKCMSCHTDVTGLKNAHGGVTVDTKVPADLKLTKTMVDEKTCLSSACHNTTLAELVKKTVASTVLTDANGTVINPHLAPTLTKAHVDAKMTCSKCHAMHVKLDPKAYCVSCHHQSVFVCGTCHT
ncbi:MAG: hypothetical protein HGA39_08865 [Coriobacteriia bacterium]|nr:hypothetical protein [Coriobacteriia bacterium]